LARTLIVAFRWGIFLLACAFLWTHLTADKGTQALAVWHAMRSDPGLSGLLLLVVALMLLNWGLESMKWRALVAPVQRVGAVRAWLATIAGTSLALITPNRTGEFLGRVLFLDPGHRIAGSFATALGSIAQFVVTLVMGGSALVLMLLLDLPMPWPAGWISTALVSLTAMVSTGALLLYLRPSLLRQLLLLLPFLWRLEAASSILNGYRGRDLAFVLFLSALRYVVFTFQFVLLLGAFGSGVASATAMLVVPVVYLVSTLVPTVLFTEPGIRGTAAIAMFMPLGGNESAVLFATFGLWLVNLVVPALAGSVIMLFARIGTTGGQA
jgi:hypothetical protein